MSLSLFPSARAFTALALASLLGGCAQGTYTDSTEPDAAKLRFISNTSNTTVDIYDEQHCKGQTTGMLNNILMVDTKRRVDMRVPPPAKARGLLEFKLEPGKKTMLMINTIGGASVCGKAFSFTPKAGEEYEVTFNAVQGGCSTMFQRLSRFDGKDVRIPQPLFETGMPACQGQSPIFGKAIPETPQRKVLIERIVESRVQSVIATEAASPDRPQTSPQELDALIVKRKAAMGAFSLPEDYWAQYRQNYALSNQEAAGRQARALGLYKDVYSLRLGGTEDATLEQWMQPEDSAIKELVKANDTLMDKYYADAKKSVMLDEVNHHLERMAQLDQRFGVCAHFDKCWRY
ncbi:hypothetical protein RGV33_32005 [Pseudomonas sp. Bout1]|uniref:hypothetical protein n=1 Tax=Pseudomonas sp. Bout1 TaxID=3048600 RepID=UPI002AB3A837|nr:hypothetical protein [Pseudomonas sp. Bout1]MDY7536249.1 hypothetical protein [Pseudomonas sp. Bout1]MEB0183587.1 hypothetical protein [Pseudomonas sp. Bout1]